jgi:hypothetical protein
MFCDCASLSVASIKAETSAPVFLQPDRRPFNYGIDLASPANRHKDVRRVCVCWETTDLRRRASERMTFNANPSSRGGSWLISLRISWSMYLRTCNKRRLCDVPIADGNRV